jgi:glycerol-3-phosphate dehydrogenase (NAD(P)+)
MKVAILGNGDWGSAIAQLSNRRSHSIQIWARNPRDHSRETNDLGKCLSGSEVVFFAVPSHAMREVALATREHLPKAALLVSLAKGIEEETGKRMSEVLTEVTGRTAPLVLSGPSFASEVSRGDPCAVVCASPDESAACRIQTAFTSDDFRIYTNVDLAGVEWGGSLKNVIAIAAGVCVGLQLGQSALAALITRGMAELTRIGTILGGKTQTFFGLSGVGDLILTCSSSLSRNRRLGEALGRGESLPHAVEGLKGTPEGLRTARSVHQILKMRGMEAPILQEVYSILYEQKQPMEAVRQLMAREPKPEF